MPGDVALYILLNGIRTKTPPDKNHPDKNPPGHNPSRTKTPPDKNHPVIIFHVILDDLHGIQYVVYISNKYSICSIYQ